MSDANTFCVTTTTPVNFTPKLRRRPGPKGPSPELSLQALG